MATVTAESAASQAGGSAGPGVAPGTAPGEVAGEIIVEVTRGDQVESRHSVAVAVADVTGRVPFHRGDIGEPVYPRSAIKPLQALALLETGAADHFALGDAEVALACASHGGEPRHVELVTAWLERIGCTADDLECGSHWPSNEAAARAMAATGGTPDARHNNCSGKHTGFLSVARHLGHPTAGYIRYDHPVQQRILGILEAMTGLDLSRAPRGIDGCGIPTLAVPLGNLALAMARLADPSDQPDARQAACARVRRAMAAEPFLVAGSGRFCTAVMERTGERALIKTGAEGVYCGTLPALGLGIALKARDGASRAAVTVMGSLLAHLGVLDAADRAALAESQSTVLTNRAGREVGEIRLAAGSGF